MPICPHCGCTDCKPAKEAPSFCWKCRSCFKFFCERNVNYEILQRR